MGMFRSVIVYVFKSKNDKFLYLPISLSFFFRDFLAASVFLPRFLIRLIYLIFNEKFTIVSLAIKHVITFGIIKILKVPNQRKGKILTSIQRSVPRLTSPLGPSFPVSALTGL